MSQYRKGANAERRLEKRLWKEGWATFRVAGSGTVNHASADLVAIKRGDILVFEVKTAEDYPVQIHEYDQLEKLEERIGEGLVYVALYVSGGTVRIYEPTERITADDEWEYGYKVIGE